MSACIPPPNPANSLRSKLSIDESLNEPPKQVHKPAIVEEGKKAIARAKAVAEMVRLLYRNEHPGGAHSGCGQEQQEGNTDDVPVSIDVHGVP